MKVERYLLEEFNKIGKRVLFDEIALEVALEYIDTELNKKESDRKSFRISPVGLVVIDCNT